MPQANIEAWPNLLPAAAIVLLLHLGSFALTVVAIGLAVTATDWAVHSRADLWNCDASAGNVGAATFAGHPIAPQALVASGAGKAATGLAYSDGYNLLRHDGCDEEQSDRGQGG